MPNRNGMRSGPGPERPVMIDRLFLFVETYVFPALAIVVTIAGVGQAFVPESWKLAVEAFFGL
jgi:hypothetical protein